MGMFRQPFRIISKKPVSGAKLLFMKEILVLGILCVKIHLESVSVSVSVSVMGWLQKVFHNHPWCMDD